MISIQDDVKIDTEPTLHVRVRLKAIKQDPRMERPTAQVPGGDWAATILANRVYVTAPVYAQALPGGDVEEVPLRCVGWPREPHVMWAGPLGPSVVLESKESSLVLGKRKLPHMVVPERPILSELLL